MAVDRIYVTRETGRIERTDVYLVRLTLNDGTVYENLEPRRLFPVTDLDHYITLLGEWEKEIAMVRSLDDLDADSRRALEEVFKEYYLVPFITAIKQCDDKFGSLKMTVETDRGEVTFRIRNRHNDMKVLHGTRRMIIRDSNDNRYEIRNLDALDKKSQSLLFSYT